MTCATSLERKLEEPLAELAEERRVAGRQEAVGALAVAVVLPALAASVVVDLARRLLGREDERHVASEDALEDRPDQRVVRAAEDHRVAAGRLERLRVLANGVDRLLAGLDQRHELRAGDRGEADAGVERPHELARSGRP